MEVIELGVVTDPAEPPRRPNAWALSRRRDVRRGLLATVAVLSLLLVAGSAPPSSAGPHLLWSIPMAGADDSFTAADGQVYVLSGSQVEGRRLDAYGLRTGKKAASISDLKGATWIGAVQAGVVTLPAGDATAQLDTVDGNFIHETIAVDAKTGRELWHLPGELAASDSQHAVLSQWDQAGASIQTLRVAGLRDGTTAWEHTHTDVQGWLLAKDTGRLYTATRNGLLKVLDIADGSTLVSKQLPVQKQPASAERYTVISGEHQQLFVRTIVDTRATVAAYDPATLAERWHLSSETFDGFYGCGSVMCLSDAAGISGYDPATGQRRWQREGNGMATAIGNDRILVPYGADENQHTLVDSSTGATLADLGAAATVSDVENPGSRAYILSAMTDPPGRTALSEFDQRTGKVVPRGTIAQTKEYNCRASDNLLVCATADGRLTVTEVP
ncbi:PQQ-binding-like beta-propeller repeat protein [Actinoplanes sp. TFC3]|uniref:outer membrane protein assembly factor BamB family protein n=1 Tax=Actinoplanes sp. TFC3 TaxID=1710355 RepID=UPI000830A491|nr:PQQ-binding-like beta-propeller repeat protein [Actinoplanes sp. TFC3]